MTEGDVSVSPSPRPVVRGTAPGRVEYKPSPPPRNKRDFREDAIRELRAAVCRRPPPPGDVHWTENNVWIGCINVEIDKDSGPGDFLGITIKVTTGQDTDDVWAYYQAHQTEIMGMVRSKFPGGNLRMKSLRIEKGSVTIIVIVQIVIGLVAIAVAILGNWDSIERNFRRAVPYVKQYIMDTIDGLKGMFRRFGLG